MPSDVLNEHGVLHGYFFHHHRFLLIIRDDDNLWGWHLCWEQDMWWKARPNALAGSFPGACHLQKMFLDRIRINNFKIE
jgi:hypothetical protein